jgi:hypothetical protein
VPKLHTKKLRFYVSHVMRLLLPRFLLQQRLPSELRALDHYDSREINDRVDYYCKVDSPFTFNHDSKSYKDLTIFAGRSAPCLDLKQYMRYFSSNHKFDFDFRDYGGSPKQPTFVKCRPLRDNNSNSVLMKLNSGRFYDFDKDVVPFIAKADSAVFRGPCHKQHRQVFIENTFRLPNTDIGDTRKSVQAAPYYKSFLSIPDQLRNKYIISVEGNDVASNLPWIMASNSLAFMTKPTYEGWFMQGRLIPNHHYVLLRDDYSDLPEKIYYYNRHTQVALEIIANAQKHVFQFFDHKREKLISLLVLKKYFELSGQM